MRPNASSEAGAERRHAGREGGQAHDIAAVVLAARGGASLERSLASVGWAAERVVLDPAARLEGEALPRGVVRGRLDPGSLTRSPWLLLLMEDEVATPALAAAAAAAVGAAAGRVAFRIPVEVTGFGARLRPRGAPVRLATREGARLRFHAAFGADLAPGAGRVGRLGTPIVTSDPGSVAEALLQLDADGAALAALLRAEAIRPRLRHLLLPPVAAAASRLSARAAEHARWARWALTVFAGYRALVAYAKLWEMRQAEGVDG
jgi:hypothetical protein